MASQNLNISKAYIIISLCLVFIGGLWGLDKWIDSKIGSHPAVVSANRSLNYTEQDILEVKEYILRVEDKIDRLNAKFDLLLSQGYP